MLNPYMLYIKIGVAVLVLGVIGYLYFLVDHYKGQVKLLTQQIEELENTNIINKQTIEFMKIDATRATKLCASRLAEKDKTIKELEKIYNLTEGTVTNEGNTVFSGNAVLDALNSMYPQAGSAGGVCKTGSSASASTSSGQPGDILYCFPRSEAVKLMRNKTLHDSRETDCCGIVQSFQTGTK
jgi:hypothetical protein